MDNGKHLNSTFARAQPCVGGTGEDEMRVESGSRGEGGDDEEFREASFNIILLIKRVRRRPASQTDRATAFGSTEPIFSLSDGNLRGEPPRRTSKENLLDEIKREARTEPRGRNRTASPSFHNAFFHSRSRTQFFAVHVIFQPWPASEASRY